MHTLARATALAPAGGTVVLRAGVYHESVEVESNKPITIQSYPHEAVWLDGSTVVTGWTQRGDTWVHTGWTAKFDSTAGYTPGQPSTGVNWTFVNPAYPMASHPDQAWIDGSRLAQVGSAAQVVPGTFYVDYNSDELVIGNNPSGHEIRAADLGVALTLRADHSTVRGIGVRRYATSIPDIAMLRLTGADSTAENVIVQQAGSAGICAIGAGDSLIHVTSEENGLLGIHAGGGADGLVVRDTLSQDNNVEHFNYAPVSGGMKVDRIRGVTIANDDFLNNLGPGLWFDQSIYAANITGSRMIGNAGNGLAYEISSTAVIANNIVTDNGADGLKINDADHVRIWNNQIANNGRDIELVQDTRRGANLSLPGHNPRRQQPDPTEPWIVKDDQVADNIIGTAANNEYELYVYDFSHEYTAAQMDLNIDGNQLTTMASGGEIVWGTADAGHAIYQSVAAFTQGTGQGAHNGEVSGSGSVLTATSPQPLPADIATMVGQPAATRHLGPF